MSVARTQKRNLKREALKSFDEFTENLHRDIQTIYLYVLSKEFRFTGEKMIKLTEKCGEIMNKVNNGEIKLVELVEQINLKLQKEEKKKEVKDENNNK